MSTPSRLSWTAPRSLPTGPALWPPAPWFWNELNTDVAAAGTAEAIAAATTKLENGDLHVFDVSTFTTRADDTMNTFKVDFLKVDADGHITSYLADVDTDEAYTGDTEVVHDGYFSESEKRSAPYFDLQIDGIDAAEHRHVTPSRKDNIPHHDEVGCESSPPFSLSHKAFDEFHKGNKLFLCNLTFFVCTLQFFCCF